jgi:glutamate decarboxylase
VPGGSIGNLYGMHLARQRAAPQVKEEGAAAAGQLVAFVSQDAHYSYLKTARLIGLGAKNLISVPTDRMGRMDPDALMAKVAEARAAGKLPFFVGLTAATTVRGGFDPLREVATRLDGSNIWLHVDAAWGGGALFSPTHRNLLDGVDMLDSLSWSAHKQMGAALQCALFITRNEGALAGANAVNAAYLFQPDKLNSDLDVGDKTIQCGRKADMMKLWMLFKQQGDEGCARIVDSAFSLADHLVSKIEASDGAFVMAHPRSGCNVCFWYVPKAMRPLPPNAHLDKSHPIHNVAPKIKAGLQREGAAMVGFQAVDGLPNFFRWVFASPGGVVTNDTVDEVLSRMAEIGEA